jgi:hypothetical protein
VVLGRAAWEAELEGVVVEVLVGTEWGGELAEVVVEGSWLGETGEEAALGSFRDTISGTVK